MFFNIFNDFDIFIELKMLHVFIINYLLFINLFFTVL
jgi:hypothetical protein